MAEEGKNCLALRTVWAAFVLNHLKKRLLERVASDHDPEIEQSAHI